MKRLNDQVAIVTGGTGGLGDALCDSLAGAGAKVYACGLMSNPDVRNDVSSAQPNSNIHLSQIDVRQIGELQQWIADVITREGRVDILVNAAGICPLVDWDEVTEALWDDVMSVNLKSAFFASQSVLGAMIAQRKGAIINVGSTAGYNGGVVTTPAYGASKGGLHTLTKWLAVKTAPHGIRVNTVVPGPFRSPMTDAFTDEMRERLVKATPNHRIGLPEDVVQSILFLADAATSGHMTGAALDVCGGAYLR